MIGNYKSKLDDKGRMTIPSKLRDDLGSDIVVSFGFENAIEMRTKEDFDSWSNEIREKGNLDQATRRLQRIILSNSFHLTVDKSGRVNMPDNLLGLAKIDKEITLCGIGDKVEIFATELWEKENSNPDELSKEMEELAKLIAGN